MTLEEKVAQALISHQKTLAVAESCTGGLLTHRLTNIPGSSNFLKLGIVTYSNESKKKLLGVSSRTLRHHGAVSSQTAIAMAKGIRLIHKTDFGIGITGIAGPTGGTKKKPVGLTFIAIQTPQETLCLKYLFRKKRSGIKSQAATSAMKLLLDFFYNDLTTR